MDKISNFSPEPVFFKYREFKSGFFWIAKEELFSIVCEKTEFRRGISQDGTGKGKNSNSIPDEYQG